MNSINFDYAVHSDFLIHWTGKDIDQKDKDWQDSDKSGTPDDTIVSEYLIRLENILKYGFWMTSEKQSFEINKKIIELPHTAKTCFTELKLSESRKHARQYGRLGIGVKRMFLFNRSGRPVSYFGLNDKNIKNDMFLEYCSGLDDKNFLNFFKPMNSTEINNYDLYSESEWRILYSKKQEDSGLILDPRNPKNPELDSYFKNLKNSDKLEYLIPLDGWLSMIIYPSVRIKNAVQKKENNGIHNLIKEIKSKADDEGNIAEKNSWPIELDLDACRNF